MVTTESDNRFSECDILSKFFKCGCSCFCFGSIIILIIILSFIPEILTGGTFLYIILCTDWENGRNPPVTDCNSLFNNIGKLLTHITSLSMIGLIILSYFFFRSCYKNVLKN